MSKPGPKPGFGKGKFSYFTLEDYKKYFLTKVVKLPEGCWEFKSLKLNGYGQIGYKNKMWLAHRLSFWFFKGKIPEGICVCHSCDNPKCVNPEHLWLGDRKANAMDALKKKRTMSGEKNKASKLTWDKVKEIRLAKAAKGKFYGNKMFADKFGVDKNTISCVVKNKNWLISNEPFSVNKG